MQILEAGQTTITCLAFTPEGEVIAGTRTLGVLRWDADATPRKLITLEVPRFTDSKRTEIHCVRCNTRGVMAAGTGQSFLLHRLSDGNTEHHSGIYHNATAVEFLDDQTLLVGSGDRVKFTPGQFEIWKLVLPYQQLMPVFKESKGVVAIAAHTPTRIVAWANGSRRVSIWNPERQTPKLIPLKHTAPAIAFHPDGTRLAVAQEWGVKLFDVTKLYEVLSFDGHKGRVTSVAFSLDGRVLATGSWDKTVRLWNAENGKLIAAYEGPTGKVYTLAYSADGLRLAAAGDAGTVVVWDVD